MLRGPWAWRTKWRLYAGAAAALGALLVTLAVVVPRGDTSPDQLIAAEPTPTVNTEVTPTSAPTPTPEASPDASESPPAASPAPTLNVTQRAMLSDQYVTEAFGRGHAALVQRATTQGSQWVCLDPHGKQGPYPSTALSRSWAWAGETGVAEVLAEYESVSDARKGLAACGDADRFHSDAARSTAVDVADGAFILRDPIIF